MARMYAQGKVNLVLDDNSVKELPVTIIENTENDGWFEKLYLQSFISSLEDISNAKLQVALYLLTAKDKTGKIILTQEQIAQATGISKKTINTTMQILFKSKFLVKAGKCYQINPYVMYSGRSRNILLRDINNPAEAVIYQPAKTTKKPLKTPVVVSQGILPTAEDAKAV